MTALVVPFICNPLTSQLVTLSRDSYEHLLGLELADSADVSDVLEIDVLIGLDTYWDLVTGKVIRGRDGPTLFLILLVCLDLQSLWLRGVVHSC